MRSSSHQNPSAARPVEIRFDVSEHFGDVFVELVDSIAHRVQAFELLANLAELVLDHGQAAWEVVGAPGGRFALPGWQVAGEYCGQVTCVPVECGRQRLKRSPASSALSAVVLEFSDDGLGHAGPVGEFALADVEFGHALVDRLCDRRPVSGHVLLRAPPECRA